MPTERRDEFRGDADGSIRGAYEAHGVEAYYHDFGGEYRNPHEPIVRRVLQRAVQTWTLDLSHVLDLAAGSGEVTLALRELGAKTIEGIDPYTADAYAARTGAPAEQHRFEDIAAGALAGRRYSLIVCSFALHLCAPSRLPGVCSALSLIAPEMLIITPHKRPVIRPEWGWTIHDEMIVERVRARILRSGAG